MTSVRKLHVELHKNIYIIAYHIISYHIIPYQHILEMLNLFQGFDLIYWFWPFLDKIYENSHTLQTDTFGTVVTVITN